MSDADKTGPKQLAPFQFRPGQSGNPKGRPQGARARLADAFLDDMLDSWKTNGKDAITRVLEARPQDYLKVIAAILPKEVKIDTSAMEELTDADLARIIDTLRPALRPEVVAAGAGKVGAGTGTTTVQ
jgi:Family of unknown function (DUF5681)